MRYDYVRSDWESPSQRVSGPRFVWRDISQIVIHYVGVGGFSPPRDIAQWIRNQQGFYLRSRGYSIGYNASVVSAQNHPLDGSSWELRGDSFRSAANKGVNHVSFAIQIIQVNDQPPTEAAIEGVRRLVAQIQERRPDVRIVGHRTSGGTTQTACPGRGLLEAVEAGVFFPVPSPIIPNVPQPIKEAEMYVTTKPTRVYDSRSGRGPLSRGETISVSPNIPSGSTAVHANVTAIFEEPGFVTVWDEGGRPDASILNGNPSSPPVPNAVTIPVDSRGRFQLHSSARAHIIVDVMGYHR